MAHNRFHYYSKLYVCLDTYNQEQAQNFRCTFVHMLESILDYQRHQQNRYKDYQTLV